ncbi:penicillin-binding protein 2 [candidate division KSB1 bacterium]|nr:penicillin-binding protein 2 [candidate division KSB1 bacterium]
MFSTIILLFVFILLVKLFQLQIYERKKYRYFSDMNRIRRVRLLPTRGNIYDRNGNILVENQPSYSLFAVPFESKKEKIINLLTNILNDSTSLVRKKLTEARNPFTPIKIWPNLEFERLVQIEERKLELPGVYFKVEPKRNYPDTVNSAHLLGYLAEVSKNELEALKGEDILQGDIIGKKGIEKAYDKELRGSAGYNFIEVNAFGQEIEDKEFKGEGLPQPGRHLYLTLDLELQKLAENLFADKNGGAVFLDVRNGDVLVLCSKPDFDLNYFSGNIPQNIWNGLINDPSKPLFDRMIQGEFPPGSTFKLVMLAAALEEKTVNAQTTFTCNGYYRFGARVFDCWKKSGHGTVDLTDAIKMSCNVYMYNVSLNMDVDVWARYAKQLGFGKSTGIDLPGERSGNVPDKKYLDTVYKKTGWTKGMLLNLGIGQGDLLTTPIQMAQLAMIFANSGIYYKPHVVQRIVDSQSYEFFLHTATAQQAEGISEQTFSVLRNGMKLVVNGANGTGRACYLPNVVVAGKTGTAQNPHGDDHAWFIGFAPYENPQIAFCVFIENGGGGGAQAAPIARELLKKYFEQQQLFTNKIE